MIERIINIPWVNSNGEKNEPGTQGFKRNQPLINEIYQTIEKLC